MSIPKAGSAHFRPERKTLLDTTARRLVAKGLMTASGVLSQLAVRLTSPDPPAGEIAHLEFHAVAGASDGALYLDGEWIGVLVGVTRL